MEQNAGRTLNGNASCIDEITLLKYALRSISAEEEKRIETHLGKCGICLMKVQEFVYIQNALKDSRPETDVPLELVEKVNRGRDVSKSETPSADSVPRLMIRIGAEGIKLLKESVVPKSSAVEWTQFTMPQYAFRGKEEQKKDNEMVYKETRKEKNISIAISLRKDSHESLEARITVEEFLNPMQNLRITLKREHMIVRSKKTDAEGAVRFSKLNPGRYFIQLPSENIEWEVDISL